MLREKPEAVMHLHHTNIYSVTISNIEVVQYICINIFLCVLLFSCLLVLETCCITLLLTKIRPPDKSMYWTISFFISHPKSMLWVLKRTVLMRRFF